MTTNMAFLAGMVTTVMSVLLTYAAAEYLSRRRLKPPDMICGSLFRGELSDVKCTLSEDHSGPHSCRARGYSIWWEQGKVG